MASIRIIHKMIPTTNRNFPNALLNRTGDLWVTVHETGNTNPGADAASEARFSVNHHGGEHTVSYHFAVDQHGAYQMLPLDRIGYHAGDGCNSRTHDTGCFASVAIETCVGDNNAHRVKTRENLVTLITMILRGDPAIDFGITDHNRFSSKRIAPHKKWSSYSKDCPRFMLSDGYFWTLAGRVERAMTVSVTPSYVPRVPHPRLRVNNLEYQPIGGKFTVKEPTPRLSAPRADAPMTGPVVPVGSVITGLTTVVGEDSKLYVVSDYGTFFDASDLSPSVVLYPVK